MQFTTVPGITAPCVPELVSKTDKSITVRVKPSIPSHEKRLLKYQVSCSEHGYLYYSWNESQLFESAVCPIEGLHSNMNYVIRARMVDEEQLLCSEWSELSSYIRTFTEEEDAKRSGTYFEHALRMEREKKIKLQSQIQKLTTLLEDRSKDKLDGDLRVKHHENMLSSRRLIDTKIQSLQFEVHDQALTLEHLIKQREQDEKVIIDLLNEQERLRATQPTMNALSSLQQKEVQELREQLEKNEEALRQHQEQVTEGAEKISQYEKSLEQKRLDLSQKEKEVEKLMADCNRMVQEQADTAHAKQVELEEALLEAKASLEQQLDINTYLRQEVSRFREENHHLKNQIEEMDSKIAEKLVTLEDENMELRHALGKS